MIQPKNLVPVKFKIFSKNILWKYRQSTWSLRKLPDFLVVGAMKSGTTSLYAYLIQHPQISKPNHKEIYFFSTDLYYQGIKWYKAHFPLKTIQNTLTFEASTDYIFVPKAVKRIHQCLPNVKIILLLRNPVDRAVSHYFHEIQRYREHLSISEALQYEKHRLPQLETILERDIKYDNYKNDPFIHFSYQSRGLYIEQIKRFLGYFPKNRLLIINSEKFYAQPNDVMTQIYHFLDLNPDYIVKDFTPRNVTPNSIKTHIPKNVYNYLNDYFKPYNQALYKLIDNDFNW